MQGIELPNEKLGGNENLHIALGGVSLLFALSGEPIPEPVPASERLGAYHIAFLVGNCKRPTCYFVDRGAQLAIKARRCTKTITASFLAAPDGMIIELKQISPAKNK